MPDINTFLPPNVSAPRCRHSSPFLPTENTLAGSPEKKQGEQGDEPGKQILELVSRSPRSGEAVDSCYAVPASGAQLRVSWPHKEGSCSRIASKDAHRGFSNLEWGSAGVSMQRKVLSSSSCEVWVSLFTPCTF